MITTLLVANRGEIARRVFRTARALGLRCVAVHSDADAGAPFVGDADEAVRLPGGYLDGTAIVDAALATGADAVHPGYGFLSENADFAAAVVDAGLTWVGPPPPVIETMGDKLAAKEAAVAAGVPVLPSGGEAGFPLLVKAAAGGGGKGMRVVSSAGELDEAIAAARREAASAFGDDRVFLERYVRRARHVEIQIVGDRHGTVAAFGERECSIQRRHQKIVEEAPSPALAPAVRAGMVDAAVGLARSIGYESAGTVEFLLDDDTGEFFFLEVNTRLQVEHPVTEEVHGCDLVALQLAVANGQALDAQAPDGGAGASGTAAGVPDRHAIEVRLYAEDPAADFLPATGRLVAFEPAGGPGIRWESGVAAGSVVGVDFDPMLAKVVASAPTRAEAAARLAAELERLHLGGVTTNRDFLAAVLRHPAFLAGDTTTDFVGRVRPAPPAHDLGRAAAAGALWLQGRNRARAAVLGSLPSGWRNARLPDQQVLLRAGDVAVEVTYRARRDGAFDLGDGRRARVHAWSPGSIDLEVDRRRAVHRVTSDGHRLHVQVPTGTVSFDVVPRFEPPPAHGPAGGLVAPMPGRVLDVRTAAGDRVAAGQVLVVLEAMKMEHHVRAPADGVVVEVRVAAGEQVENGALLLVLDDGAEAGGDG